MHTIIRTTAITVSLCALVACSSNEEIPSTADLNEDIACYFPNSDQESAPMWVCTGAVENLITGLGSYPATEASYNLAFQTAQLRARADLVEKLTTRLSKNSRDYEAATSSGTGEMIDRHNKLLNESHLESTLKGSRVYSSITGPDGALYVLVGIDEKLANKNLSRIIRSSYNSPEAEFIKNEAEEAFSRPEQNPE